MSKETDEIEATATALAHAMARLVSAIDAVGDDAEASHHVSEKLIEELENLAGRLSAAQGFTG
jgi:hypothetical protein